jgi:uncharacterized membrane protein
MASTPPPGDENPPPVPPPDYAPPPPTASYPPPQAPPPPPPPVAGYPPQAPPPPVAGYPPQAPPPGYPPQGYPPQGYPPQGYPPPGYQGGPPAPQSSGMQPNVASMVAYFTWIGALIMLLVEKQNRIVKFHAIQEIGLTIVWVVAYIGVIIISLIPGIGLISIPLDLILFLGGLALWVILVVKAYQGEMIKLPVIGDFAAQQAGI